MNRNELLREVQHELAKTIEPMITEYMRNHPEYFHKCVNGNGLISGFEITLSYQPDTFAEIPTITPCVFVRLAGADYGAECNRFPHHPEHLEYRVWSGKEKASEYQEDF